MHITPISSIATAALLVIAAFLPTISVAEALPKLELQDVNFVHTSDIHSWYRGHRKGDDVSKSWSGNIGDVMSFVHHMKMKAKSDQDVFLVDSGDETHGGGLSDADKPEGSRALAIQLALPYDVMTPGNHELEIRDVAKHLYHAVKRLPRKDKEKYLASNVLYYDDDISVPKYVPLAERYRTWTTSAGRKVTALGLMFNNNAKTNGTAKVAIQFMDEMVQETWFIDYAMTTNPDLFLLVGHMSISDENNAWATVHKAIRDRYPTTPIFVFAGHSHYRDCRMDFDNVGRSIAIESGRYLETVGWVSASIPKSLTEEMSFVRRYLDPSKETFQRHTGVDATSFSTVESNEVMKKFEALADSMDLNEFYGCADDTYHWDHAAYETPNHVLRFYMEKAFPKTIATMNHTQPEQPYYLLLNNGFIRGPIYKGEFTKDDKLTNIPYKQRFSVVKVPRVIAESVFSNLDRQPKTDSFAGLAEVSLTPESENAFHVQERPLKPSRYMREDVLLSRQVDTKVAGYVTSDSCEAKLGPGDDVKHSPKLKIQLPPTYIHSRSASTGHVKDYDLVDFVTIARLEGRAASAINAAINIHNEFCQNWKMCTKVVAPIEKTAWTQYGNIDSSDVIREYARKYWKAPKQPSGVNGRC